MGTTPSQRYWPATIASQESEPSVIETSTTWPWPERRASFSAARIPTAAIRPPPPEVGDLPGGLDRRAVRVAGEAEDAVQAQVVLVVAGAVAVGAVLAVARDRAVDERRVRLRELLVADAEPVEHARAEALDQHVRVPGEAQQGVLPLLLLEIEADRALVAVQRQIQRGRVPRGVCSSPP